MVKTAFLLGNPFILEQRYCTHTLHKTKEYTYKYTYNIVNKLIRYISNVMLNQRSNIKLINR